jgi:hypothetical protein
MRILHAFSLTLTPALSCLFTPGGMVDIKAVEALAAELDDDDVAVTAKRPIITTAGARLLRCFFAALRTAQRAPPR